MKTKTIRQRTSQLQPMIDRLRKAEAVTITEAPGHVKATSMRGTVLLEATQHPISKMWATTYSTALWV